MRLRSKTHQYCWRSFRRYELAGHHCRDGRMGLRMWFSQAMTSGRYAYTVRSLSPTACWVFRKEIKAATHEMWMHLSHANPRGDRAVQYKHTQRFHLKERASPYDHSTQKQGSPGTKRPFAQVIGHPYDPYVLPWAQWEGPAQQRVRQGLRSMTWWGMTAFSSSVVAQ